MWKFAVLSLLACTAVWAQSKAEVRGKWTLTELGGKKPKQATLPSLEFTDDKVSGNTGCNQFTTGYFLSGNAVKFTVSAMTKVACTDEVAGKTETEFTGVLERTANYKVNKDTLELLDGKFKSLAKFKK